MLGGLDGLDEANEKARQAAWEFVMRVGYWNSFWQEVIDEDKDLVMGLGVGESPLVQQGKR